MTRIDLKSDIIIANLAAALVMATGALNWALPLGRFISALAVLTLAANVMILPLMLLKHRAPMPMTPQRWLLALAGLAIAYAVVRSTFGITASPWSPLAMASHAILVPGAIALVYFAMLTGLILIVDQRDTIRRLAGR